MKVKSKVLSFVLALCMIIPVFAITAVPAAAEGSGINVDISAGSINADGFFVVTVSMTSETEYSIGAMDLQVVYDAEKVAPADPRGSDNVDLCLKIPSDEVNGCLTTYNCKEPGVIKIAFINSNGISYQGVFYNIYFKPLEVLELGETADISVGNCGLTSSELVDGKNPKYTVDEEKSEKETTYTNTEKPTKVEVPTEFTLGKVGFGNMYSLDLSFNCFDYSNDITGAVKMNYPSEYLEFVDCTYDDAVGMDSFDTTFDNDVGVLNIAFHSMPAEKFSGKYLTINFRGIGMFTVREDIEALIKASAFLTSTDKTIELTKASGLSLTVKSVKEIKLGCLSGNASPDSKDALLVLQYCVQKAELLENQLIAADLNADGNADSNDALAILQVTVEKKFIVDNKLVDSKE